MSTCNLFHIIYIIQHTQYAYLVKSTSGKNGITLNILVYLASCFPSSFIIAPPPRQPFFNH